MVRGNAVMNIAFWDWQRQRELAMRFIFSIMPGKIRNLVAMRREFKKM
jgi:hypothetical protein